MALAAAPLQVMIVDDSAVIRGLLSRIVDAEPDMRVVASAGNGAAALEILRRRHVDVVILDIEMPEMDGLTALPHIVAGSPDVRVIMSSSLTQRGAEITLRALALGAADYVAKPTTLQAGQGMRAIAAELVTKIRALGGRSTPRQPAVPPRAGALLESPAASPPVRPWTGTPPPPRPRGIQAPVRALAIAASTGGPNALSSMLARLPRGFPLPILIVQHMPPIFTRLLADSLARATGRPCAEAVDGEPIRAGHAYVAPGDHHMIAAYRHGSVVLRLNTDPPENFCRPSADPLLRSLADLYGPSLLVLVLTGMGSDGLQGCRAVVEAGGRVLAQDQETSVVWGMPGAVAEAGLAAAVLPLDRIAAHVDMLCGLPV
jgi:two-component system, chemotaxis family, protein-glutamate methylesterase/glutaminase